MELDRWEWVTDEEGRKTALIIRDETDCVEIPIADLPALYRFLGEELGLQ